MRPLLRIFAFMLRAQPRAFFYGWVLSFVVLVAGAALLGLSGWFITAAAAAGLAGLGAGFDVFRPSAMVRFLALGRTAARYGERLSTHDATLRTLTTLRVRLMTHLAAAPWAEMIRLRGARALNRLMADTDALDGIPLRLILPIGAGLVTHLAAFAVLWALIGVAVPAAILAIHLTGATLIFAFSARAAHSLSAAAEEAAQTFRAGLIDLIGARSDLMVYGRLAAETAALHHTDTARRAHLARIDRIERNAGAALTCVAFVALAAALWIGLRQAGSGALSPAQAALGAFAALGLAETLAPLRRAIADLGRMGLAARRMQDSLQDPNAAAPPPAPPQPAEKAPPLALRGLGFQRAGAARPLFQNLEISLYQGEILALTGPSGAGKSTLLEIAAGLTAPSQGAAEILGIPARDWPEPALRDVLALVAQRSRLVAGTVRENLALAAPGADDAALESALASVELSETLGPRGGLDAVLGPGGAGLSGGQARRLVLARAVLRNPRVLLLDEPTEGLDRATAGRVLSGLRTALPETTILIAAHRDAEIAWADRCFDLTEPVRT